VSRAIRRHYSASGATHDVDLSLEKGRLHGHVEGRAISADARIVRAFPGGADLVVTHEAGRARAVVLRDGDTVHVAIRGRVFRLAVVAARQESDAIAETGNDPFVASPMTGVVRQVAAEPGRKFAAGETLVVVEAMKMEHEIRAPHDGVVRVVKYQAGERVPEGAALIELDAGS
jgi:3-methylcrotonyl-CoA carboxylase alpha subunit